MLAEAPNLSSLLGIDLVPDVVPLGSACWQKPQHFSSLLGMDLVPDLVPLGSACLQKPQVFRATRNPAGYLAVKILLDSKPSNCCPPRLARKRG